MTNATHGRAAGLLNAVDGSARRGYARLRDGLCGLSFHEIFFSGVATILAIVCVALFAKVVLLDAELQRYVWMSLIIYVQVTYR